MIQLLVFIFLPYYLLMMYSKEQSILVVYGFIGRSRTCTAAVPSRNNLLFRSSSLAFVRRDYDKHSSSSTSTATVISDPSNAIIIIFFCT